MDPTAALEEIRRIVAREDPADYSRLVDLVDGLDGWITSGGYLPHSWGIGMNRIAADTDGR